MKKYKDKIDDFFKWVKGTELVELDNIDVSEDPVRPELTLGFRILHGRKIFGLKYNDEIEAIVCVAFCPEVPYTVREMDYMSRVFSTTRPQRFLRARETRANETRARASGSRHAATPATTPTGNPGRRRSQQSWLGEQSSRVCPPWRSSLRGNPPRRRPRSWRAMRTHR